MTDPPPSIWDERFAEQGWAFGTDPNDFLRSVTDRLPKGPTLCLGEGEGRNAVWLASQGFDVTAVDSSRVGLDKAEALAKERGVRLATVLADLEGFAIEPGAWSAIVSIWVHVPPSLRVKLHRRCVAGLAPGGMFALEAYTPSQVEHATGGPSDPLKLMSLALLRIELAGLEFEIGRELEREVNEGRYHHGRSAVVQVLARKPAG